MAKLEGLLRRGRGGYFFMLYDKDMKPIMEIRPKYGFYTEVVKEMERAEVGKGFAKVKLSIEVVPVVECETKTDLTIKEAVKKVKARKPRSPLALYAPAPQG
ncbi:MAG: hypothetical protein WC208_15265 [Gallionella sp.]|jgi:hypothetical protein